MPPTRITECGGRPHPTHLFGLFLAATQPNGLVGTCWPAGLRQDERTSERSTDVVVVGKAIPGAVVDARI